LRKCNEVSAENIMLSSHQNQVEVVGTTAISLWFAVTEGQELPQKDIWEHNDQRKKRTSGKQQ